MSLTENADAVGRVQWSRFSFFRFNNARHAVNNSKEDESAMKFLSNSIITQVAKPTDECDISVKASYVVDTYSVSPVSDDHMRPVGGVKKPRTQRFLQNLLCCFGAKPKETILPRSNGNVDHLIPGHYSPKPSEKLLLPPVRACDINKKCLIVDLDETLVHSSFKPVKNPDFIIPVEIDGIIHQVYVLKRPYVDEFLQRIGEIYECILFTASLAKYADPVADLLDRWGVFRSRLFREACVFHKGNYVKDLNRLGRDLKRVIIVDNSPASYAFHPENAIPVQSWFDDNNDTELLDIIPFMEKLSKVDNVYPLLRNLNDPVFKMVTSSSVVNGNNNGNTTVSGNNNNNNVTMTMMLKGPTVIDYQNNDRTVLTVR